MKRIAFSPVVRLGFLPVASALTMLACEGPAALSEPTASTHAELPKTGGTSPGTGATGVGGGKGGVGGAGGAGAAGAKGVGGPGAIATAGTFGAVGPTVAPACTPEILSVNVFGATCFEAAKGTSDGLLTVSPAFPTADPSVRDHACIGVFWPSAPACSHFDAALLGLPSSAVVLSVTRPECTASPGACQGVAATVTPSPADQIPPTAGVIPHGTVGGCDVCGIVVNDTLYFTNPNPIDSTLAGFVAVHKPDGSTKYFALPTANVLGRSYVAPLAGGPFVSGRVPAWWPLVGGHPPTGFPSPTP